MPRIPGYDQGPVNFQPVSGADLGAAAQGQAQLAASISAAANTIGDTIRYVQQRKARVYSNSSMAKLREFTSQAMIQGRTDAGPGGEGYTNNVLKQYDEFAKNLVNGAPNEFAVTDLTASIESFRAGVLDDASRWEATASEAKARFDVRDAAAVAANSLVTNPEWFEGVFADQMAAFKAITGSLSPEAELQERFDIANQLAISAIEGEIRLDPATAVQKLESGYWDTYDWDGKETTLITPEQKSNLLISAKRAAYKDNEVERYVMGEKVRNHLASVAETGVGVAGVNVDEIRRVYSNNGQDPDKGEIAALEYRSNLNVSRKVFAVKQGLKLATPEDRATLLAKYKPVPGSQSFADDQKVYEQLIAWNDADMKLMLDDPAIWSDQNGDVSDMHNEAGPAAAAEVSIALQDAGGVPAHKQRVLGNTQAKEIVSLLKSSEPQKVLQELAGYEGAYGKRFGNVVSELIGAGLDSKYATAYSISKFNPAVGYDLVQALNIPESDLRKDFTATRGIPWESIEAQAELIFQPLEQSQTSLAPERLPVMQETRNMFVRAAALKYKGDQSKDIEEYLEQMYNQSIGQMIDVRDTYFLPREAPNGKPIDTEARAADLERVARDEQWLRDQNFRTAQGFPPQIMAEHARWQNLSDNSGLRLVVQRGMGVVPVLDQEGKQFVIRFDELTGTQLWGAPPEKRLKAPELMK